MVGEIPDERYTLFGRLATKRLSRDGLWPRRHQDAGECDLAFQLNAPKTGPFPNPALGGSWRRGTPGDRVLPRGTGAACDALVHLGLAHPLSEHLRVDAELATNAGHGTPSRAISLVALQDKPDRTVP
jgi:hypothetical protein